MSTNDKFIQSIVELLDKMIEYQLRGSSLLAEIKLSNSDIKSEISEILRQVRERLPEEMEGKFHEYDQKATHMFTHFEVINNKLSAQIAQFESERAEIDAMIKNTITQGINNKHDIEGVLDMIKEHNAERMEQLEMTKEINSFIKNIKSKKTWIGLLTAAVIGIAGFVASITNAIDSVLKHYSQQKVTTPATQTTPTQNQLPPAATPTKP